MGETLKLRADGLEWRDVEGEVVAIDLRTATYLAVNRSGADLWRLLASGTTREILIELLVSDFNLSRERAIADVGAFLQTLAEQDVLLAT